MKPGEAQLNSTQPEEFLRLLKVSSAATSATIQETLQAMALYFWGFEDPSIREQQKAASQTVKTLTKGKRPFEQAEGIQQ